MKTQIATYGQVRFTNAEGERGTMTMSSSLRPRRECKKWGIDSCLRNARKCKFRKCNECGTSFRHSTRKSGTNKRVSFWTRRWCERMPSSKSFWLLYKGMYHLQNSVLLWMKPSEFGSKKRQMAKVKKGWCKSAKVQRKIGLPSRGRMNRKFWSRCLKLTKVNLKSISKTSKSMVRAITQND